MSRPSAVARGACIHALHAAALALIGACTGERVIIERGPPDFASSTPENPLVEYTVDGTGERAVGTFVLTVGPREDEAGFGLQSYDPTGGLESVHGHIAAAGPYPVVPDADGSIHLRYRAEGEFDWIFDRRGNFSFGRPNQIVQYRLRSIAIDIDANGLVTGTLEGVAGDRVDGANRRILPGDDVVLRLHGRIGSSCLYFTEPGATQGTFTYDPTYSALPLCRQLLSSRWREAPATP